RPQDTRVPIPSPVAFAADDGIGNCVKIGTRGSEATPASVAFRSTFHRVISRIVPPHRRALRVAFERHRYRNQVRVESLCNSGRRLVPPAMGLGRSAALGSLIANRSLTPT